MNAESAVTSSVQNELTPLVLRQETLNDGQEGESRGGFRLFRKWSPFSSKLSTFPGVAVPCILSIFSVILFLRIGYVVGMSGVGASLGMLALCYFVVMLTVLSLSAISTNGAIRGGGAYFMISRALGPEFGGSVGIIFYLANVFACSINTLGFVEALVINLGVKTGILTESLPNTSEWRYLYGTIALVFCLIICLVGASVFAIASLAIFVAVMVALISVVVSFAVQSHLSVVVMTDHCSSNTTQNHLLYRCHKNQDLCANYTSWSVKTFDDNLQSEYEQDYSTCIITNFRVIFSVLFNGVTGIMAGANMSGDLKNPSFAIPVGTIGACLFTFIIYALIMLFTGFTCSRALLHNNYNYMLYINLWHPFVTIGVLCATLSSSLSTLIGASRVLQAVAQDNLFGVFLRPFAIMKGSKRDNPVYALLLSWILVQAVIVIGELNTVAPYVAMFFLLSYSMVNLACFALCIASTPNYRPTFRFHSWHTALLGFVSCVAIMFFVNALAAGLAIGAGILLFVIVSVIGPATHWGEVSQGLIYHQVRKYLLRLDIRKRHVKLWRPQMLFLATNPRASYPMMDFVNDMKKGGLYVLGHVVVGSFEEMNLVLQEEFRVWLDFIDCTKLKAFVELTIAKTVQTGARNLMMNSGLGGMKPNTVVLGFYDQSVPKNSQIITKTSLWKTNPLVRLCNCVEKNPETKLEHIIDSFPSLRQTVNEQVVKPLEYVGIIKDAILMKKNICVLQNFSVFDKFHLRDGTIDVWPLYKVDLEGDSGDQTGTLILQLACILHMVHIWKGATVLRVMVLGGEEGEDKTHFKSLLQNLRIPADVVMISGGNSHLSSGLHPDSFLELEVSQDVNRLMLEHSRDARVIFTALPAPPDSDDDCIRYLNAMSAMSANLPSMVLVHGVEHVVTTTF
ncbi:solute carrier family 12 member 9-like [Corticium candelabrum]|uniref:solute carrier family 12 member 9-like n=1 Tax=Corticium candelabrum TaxID=121492 RepID=UPI002E267AB5|nr:solute carrier family 12 member 9-like [Corticium candelabrum]